MKKSTIFTSVAAIMIIVVLTSVVVTHNVTETSTKAQVKESLILVVGEFKAGSEPSVFEVDNRQIYDETTKTATKVSNGTKIACICEDDGSNYLNLIDWYPFIE